MSVISDIFAGGAAGVFDGLSKIISNFKADPLEVARLEVAIEQAKLQYESQVQQAVNATMQAEAKSEHWIQFSWRPVVGFTFAATIINNYILYSYFAKFGMQQIVIPDPVWYAMLTVLGAAAAGRSLEKWKGNGNGK